MVGGVSEQISGRHSREARADRAKGLILRPEIVRWVEIPVAANSDGEGNLDWELDSRS